MVERCRLKQKEKNRKKQVSLEAETQRKEREEEGRRCGLAEGDDSDLGTNKIAAEYKSRKKRNSGILKLV